MIIFVILWVKSSWKMNILHKKAEMERRKEIEKRKRESERSDTILTSLFSHS